MDIHRRLTEATIGITSTNNQLPLPNIMLIARPAPTQNTQLSSGSRAEQLVLTRWVHEGPALRRLALGSGGGVTISAHSCGASWGMSTLHLEGCPPKLEISQVLTSTEQAH